MPEEIERKFLVKDNGWRAAATHSRHLRQAYLARTEKLIVRVRVTDDVEAEITIKSAKSGLTRQEFQYSIPVPDARALMDLALGQALEKRRHKAPAEPGTWEIDVFEGEHAGLILAEIELPHEDADFTRPDWLGEEVTGDPRYYNAVLAGLSGFDEK
jgi:adenylate cyclase